MTENYSEVIEFLAKESSIVRDILTEPSCAVPVLRNGKMGYFNISKYLYKLEKAIELLARSSIKTEEREVDEIIK